MNCKESRANLDVIESVLIDSVRRPLSLQLEDKHTIVVTYKTWYDVMMMSHTTLLCMFTCCKDIE